MLAFVDPEARVRPDHPLRTVRQMADDALAELSPLFDGVYAEIGRASIPPERLLKASLLIALYSVRSERVFCEVKLPRFDEQVNTTRQTCVLGDSSLRT